MFVDANEWPGDALEQTRIQGEVLDQSLSVLNDYLTSLSLARNDPSIRGIARGDLPRLCPVILESVPMPTGERNIRTFPYQIHEFDRHRHAERTQKTPLDEKEQLSFQLFGRVVLGGEPFCSFYELMQQAIGAFNEGRFDLVGIGAGTAIEVLLSTVVRLAGSALGESQDRINGVLEAPFRRLLGDHIGRYVGCNVDLNARSDAFGRWYAGGYQLRNRVVHEGHRANRAEARSALDDASELISAVRRGLLANPNTHHVGADLQWGTL